MQYYELALKTRETSTSSMVIIAWVYNKRRRVDNPRYRGQC